MIVIIGAGPAGLSAAYHLGDRPYRVLEAEAEAGGLCRSFELAGATFDLGGHAFFTRHEYVRALVGELCEPGVESQPRQAWIHSHGTFVRYPFQSHLHGLPADVIEDCLAGLIEAAWTRDGEAPPTMRAWIEGTFGPGIAKHFLLPYNEKVWAFPLDRIATTWTSQRVVTPQVRDIVAGALRPQDYRAFPNAMVGYPARGGFFGLYRGFLDRVGSRVGYGTRVERIDLRARTLRTGSGESIDWTDLVSTMPLDELVARCDGLGDCCAEASRRLAHNSLHLVNLVLDRPTGTEMQRVYSADPDVPFHKLVINSNSSAALRAASGTAFQAEVSWSPHKAQDIDTLPERVVSSLRAMGLIEPGDRIAAQSVRSVAKAYPVQTLETAAAREHLLIELSRHGVRCAGRFGEWLYINSDDAVMRGRSAADEIIAA